MDYSDDKTKLLMEKSINGSHLKILTSVEIRKQLGGNFAQ
jgi:hypothetical protein